MEPESYIFVFVIGIISAFFLIRGVKGLIKGKMIVHNSLAKVAPISPIDAIARITQEAAIQSNPVPEEFINRDKLTEITGKALIIRACLNILFGSVALFIMFVLIIPELFDSTMNIIIKIIDTF